MEESHVIGRYMTLHEETECDGPHNGNFLSMAHVHGRAR